jgi:phosphate starvation-inducible PhoH-like protein
VAVISLPYPEAATALAGPEGVILRKLEALTGASITLRGVDLVLQGRESQLERLQCLVRALEPLWGRGESVSLVDLQAAHGAVSTGRLEEHRALASIELGTTTTGRPLRPRT